MQNVWEVVALARGRSGEVADSSLVQGDPLASDFVDDPPHSECMPPKGDQPSPEIKANVADAFNYSRANKRWNRRYRNYLRLSDLLIVSVSVFVAQVVRFGDWAEEPSLDTYSILGFNASYTFLSIVIALGWALSLSLSDTRDPAAIGSGSTEYSRIVEATIQLFGALAIFDLLLKLNISRGYLLISFPLGLLTLLFSRLLWRKWLDAMRKRGKCLDRALIVGEPGKAQHVARQINSSRSSGLKIVGVATSSAGDRDDSSSEVILTDFSVSHLVSTVDETHPDAVVLVGEDRMGPREIRQLGWELEERSTELIVSPPLTDIAGPRIHTRPVAGLSLISVEYAQFTGIKYWVKRLADIVGSSLLILLLSPLLLIVALLVKSGGPVIFRQERVGKNGLPFKMLKFRSMVVDAESRLAELEAKSDGNGVMFKMKDDPRITKVGRFLRRYSIDELPQLFNVLGGTMSLVGPRPALPKEVATYDEWATRRLLVQPGITGLWQVSGRSNLSWEESVRLDQYYVENWSITTDLLILLRTLKAVVGSDGAY